MKKTLLFISLFAFYLSLPCFAYADSMGDSNYILELNTTNTASQNNQPANSTNQLPPKYKIQSGFPGESSLNAFTVSIDSNLIDFGIVSATSPVTRTSTMSISNAQMGYQILSSENHQLSTNNRQFIPDATCDDGNPCTESIPGLWESVTTFGFGYHCQNTNNSICDNSASGENLYKHFADSTFGEEPQQIIQNINNVNKVDQATVNYKVNISGNQQNGLYTNEVDYLAVPNF